MGEIRSTMDIIMEKTKNLTMSEEEKAQFNRKALQGKVKGLVQKFLDDLISLPSIRLEMESEKKKHPAQAEELLKGELMERLEPDSNNEKVFQLLEEILGIDTNPFKRVITEFQEEVTKERALKVEGLRKKLAEREISGPAVVPNPDLDETWSQFYKESKRACKERLAIMPSSQTTGSQ